MAGRLQESKLWSVSSERYWLLSVLEDRTHLVCQAEGDSVSDSAGAGPVFAYVLWQLQAEPAERLMSAAPCSALVQALITTVRALLDHRGMAAHQTIVLEIDAAVKPGALDAMRRLAPVVLGQLDYHFPGLTTRAVSMTDHVAACPGLDRVVGMVERLPSGQALLMVPSRAHLMGPDPEREPDAVEGVSQFVVGDCRVHERCPLVPAPVSTDSSKIERSMGSRLINVAGLALLLMALVPQIHQWLPQPVRQLASSVLPWRVDGSGND